MSLHLYQMSVVDKIFCCLATQTLLPKTENSLKRFKKTDFVQTIKAIKRKKEFFYTSYRKSLLHIGSDFADPCYTCELQLYQVSKIRSCKSNQSEIAIIKLITSQLQAKLFEKNLTTSFSYFPFFFRNIHNNKQKK